ncbi:MAG: hypothetical protein K6C36_04885 [Clostridia bacterium]|nr:hypothetical protein [Clostridia bacterium]
MSFFYKAVCFIMALYFSMLGMLGGLFPPKGGEDLRVTAYLVADNAAAVENMDISHLGDVTDIILIGALAGFDTEGHINLNSEFDGIIRAVREKTEGFDIRLQLNIFGPWGNGSSVFEENMQAMGEQHKQAFDSGNLEPEIRSVLENYGLNGVSFDYEFPLSDEQKRDYGDFLVSLDRTLGDEYTIGCALSAWCAGLPAEAIAVIDRAELMCYDVWDYQTHAHSSLRNAKDLINNMFDLGYKPEQLELGLPFYARPTTEEAIWYNWADYYDKVDRIGLYEDEQNGVTASFNTPDLIYAKTRYAVSQKLGGVFVWHYACDVPADNASSLFNAIVRAKGK